MKPNVTWKRTREGLRSGFTLVEVMIVVLIIGLLAVIGMPSWRRARKQTVDKTMQNNARLLTAAVQQWAMEHAATPSTTINAGIIGPYIKGGWSNLVVGAQTPHLPDTVLGYYETNTLVDIAQAMYY